MTEYSMNSLNEFTSNFLSVIADENFTKKSDNKVQEKLLTDKPNNFTGLTPPGRVLISNPSGNVRTSDTDASILDHIKGVHTDIQQQIDNIPISLLESSNIIENKISMMTDKISQYHNIISSNLENQKNALKMDEISEGESHKLFKYGNYYNSLTVDGTAAAASYRIKGSVTISGAVQENYNTESIEIVNELNSPAMKVVNNVSSNILSVNHGTSGENNRVTVLSNGNVGIGVSNPQEKLHVNGNIKVVGTINGVSQNDIENFKNITGNIQQQLDNIGLGISDLSLNVNDKFGENDSNTSNYVEQTRDKLFDKMTVMETSVSNYVDATFDTFMTGKQNKITFGDGFSYDTSNNTLTVSTTNTLWNENVETNSISYGNVVVYGDRIEINDKEVATISVVNRKQNVITGAASTILTSDLPANKVLVTNTEGKVVASEVDTSKLNYLTNVTAPIQPQLDTISSQVTATSSEFTGLVNTSISNASNYTAKIKSEFQGPVNYLYEPLTFGSGLVYDEATKTLSTDGTFVYQGTVTTSDSVWTSNEEYINYGQIKIYQDHVKVQDKQIATNVDFSAKQDKIVFPENIYNNENTISLAPSVWEDKGHYVRYKNTRIYNNRVTIGIDDTVDVKKYPPIGLPGITGSEQSGVIKTISGQTYGNGSYKIEWSSYSSGSPTLSLLFNGNQNESNGAYTGAFYNSNGEIIPYSGSSYHYLVSDYYGEWISLEFPERIYLSFVKLFPRRTYPQRAPKDYKIYGQNNDLTWDEILHETDAVYANNVHISEYCFPKKSYRKYGLVVNKVFSPGTILNFSEIEFFGTPDETLYVTTDDFANDTSNMLAWYKFDGDLLDSSGNLEQITVSNFDFSSIKKLGSESLEKVSSPAYAYVSSISNNYFTPTNNFSVAFWCYKVDIGTSNYEILLTTRNTGINNKGGWSILGNGTKIFAETYKTSGAKQSQLFNVGVGWVHVAFVLNYTSSSLSSFSLYLNGILQPPSVNQNGDIYCQQFSSSLNDEGNILYIGADRDGTTLPCGIGTKFDDVRIYNRALTSEEIRVIYRAGRPVLYDFFADTSDMLAWYKFDGNLNDSSGNGKDLTGGTGTSFVDDSVVGTKSISFPNTAVQGLSSTVDLSANKSFSVSAWTYRNTNGTPDQILTTPGVNAHHKVLYFGYSSNNNFTFAFVGNDLDTESFSNDIGKWNNWIGTYDSSSRKRNIYKNGTLVANDVAIADSDFNTNINIGISNGAFFNGKLDDVRIYNRALTPDEIYTLYAKGNMISDGYAELHNIKADKLMPYNSSSINVGKHVNIRASVDTTESLSSRIVNSQTDVVETRENPYCMKLEKDLWMDSAGIIWTSDERIKKDITDIDDNVALQQILAIEPKTYKYIDNATKGDKTVYGFISQQIEDVIPEATKKTSRYIPNIYQYCEYNSSNNTIRIPADFDISRLNTLIADKFTSNYDEMSSNIVVINENHLSTKLKIKDERNEDVVLQYSMTSNEDGYELQIHNRDFTHYASSSLSSSSNIFVYGTEINDLTTLDKSYIYTLNTCATQELSRKVDSLRLTNDTLSGYIDSLEYRINIIRDYITSNIS
jgi:hypothetical protein